MALKTARLGSVEDAIQYDDLDFPTAASFGDPIEVGEPSADEHAARYGHSLGSDKMDATADGGLGVYLTNKTGANSVKGTLVVIDNDTNNAVKISNADSFDCMGAIAEDGVADGQEVLVAFCGRVKVLLEDNTFARRRHWVRTSPKTGGRAYAESDFPPGEDFADSLSVTTGTLTSGVVDDLEENNGNRVTITEAAGAGLLATLTFNNVYVVPDNLQLISSRYNGSAAHTMNVEIYNNNTTVWDNLGTMPFNAAYADFEFDLGSSPADYINGSQQVQVRFNHGTPALGTHTLDLDQVKLVGPDNEHFKEIGHCMEDNDGGINQLVAIMMHFL